MAPMPRSERNFGSPARRNDAQSISQRAANSTSVEAMLWSPNALSPSTARLRRTLAARFGISERRQWRLGCSLLLLLSIATLTSVRVVNAEEGEALAPEDQGSGDGSGDAHDPEAEWSGGNDASLPPSESTATPRPAPSRAWSRVTREQLRLRLPRSAPDALRFEAGVFVQQTAQSQASPYIRGRTGQQVLLAFDDIRLNNALFRQGPNQYFFTVDVRTLDHIDVVRGSSSVLYGSDAIAGAIIAQPLDPRRGEAGVLSASPRVFLDYGSASDEFGGRLQTHLSFGDRVALLLGVGARRANLLESAGPIVSPDTGEPPEVPRFDDDGRTQLGTGFDEITADMRAVWWGPRSQRVTAAAYVYRQSDAPRTDQCPPAFAPFDECLTIDEQSRTLAYARWEGQPAAWLKRLRITGVFQRQHELREAERPSSFTLNGGRDDVNSVGLTLTGEGKWRWHDQRRTLALRFGAEAWHDRVSSAAWLIFSDTDPQIVRVRSRGQYLDASTYSSASGHAELRLTLIDRLTFRAGSRASVTSARAPGDPESQSDAVDQLWGALVSGGGVEWQATPWLGFTAGADQGFRAPNLDDLTSRQRTGPGFQLENAALTPERSLTLEVGAQVRHSRVELDGWVYAMRIQDGISRVNRTADACPTTDSTCANAWNILQLVNVPGAARVRGAEGRLTLIAPYGLSLRSTVAWARGEEPLLGGGTQPMSRIPPLNGTEELLWESWFGLTVSVRIQWANTQSRLALSDVSDERIPLGGTPGYSVWGASFGYAVDEWLALSLVVQNLADTPWRTHGSSINGAGRSVLLSAELGLP